MSMKKLLCNPPAERMAESGDPVVLGLFEGAGEGVYQIADEAQRDAYVKAVTNLEAYYIHKRQELARLVEEVMHDINATVAPRYDYNESDYEKYLHNYQSDKAEKNPKRRDGEIKPASNL